jgi:rSAM/selenodomain-associated transferase 2
LLIFVELYLPIRRAEQQFYSAKIFCTVLAQAHDFDIGDVDSVKSCSCMEMRRIIAIALGYPAKRARMQVSIIVPVFNEALLIRPFLAHLRERAPGAEIIVADGASTDCTADVAKGFCDHLVEIERSRAMQMNAGARAAHGDVLWFLHADAEVPQGCLDEIARMMADLTVAGGYFRIRLPRGAVYRLTDSFAHYAGIALRMRCGDHGIFCRRSAFVDAGGFPDVPLMEDVEFFRRLRRSGRVMHSDMRILVSARRYETIGPARLTCAYGFIAALYACGVPLSALARIYKRTCCAVGGGSISPNRD